MQQSYKILGRLLKRIQLIALAMVATLSCATTSATVPEKLTVVLFRHGEKPSDPSNNDLMGYGMLRAQALSSYLPQLIQQNNWQLGAVYGMFADDASVTACPNPNIAPDYSYRPWQTITPFADSVSMLNGGYDRCHYPDMVSNILRDPTLRNKVVFICWDHDVIPQIAQAFGVSDENIVKSMAAAIKGTSIALAKNDAWPAAVYNWIWQIDVTLGSTPTANLTIYNQQLPSSINIPSWASNEPPISEPEFLPDGLPEYCTQAADKSYSCQVDWSAVNVRDLAAYK